jgi:hypothetical protein
MRWSVTFAYPGGSQELRATTKRYSDSKRIAELTFREHPTCEVRVKDSEGEYATEIVYMHRGQVWLKLEKDSSHVETNSLMRSVSSVA